MALLRTAFVLSALLFATLHPSAAASQLSGVTLRVYDIVGVPPDAMMSMQATTAAAMAPADIAIRWAFCPDDEPRPAECNAPQAGDVIVRLIDTHPVSAPACGFAMAAPGGGGFISLSRACAARTVMSLRRRASPAFREPALEGEVMGYFLAHEIAHVLLPGMPHSHAGIFRSRLGRAEWDSLELGSLSFLPEDIDRLRKAASLTGAGTTLR